MRALTEALILFGVLIGNTKSECTITNIKSTQRISCTNVTVEDYLMESSQIRAGLLNPTDNARISIEIEDSRVPLIDDWLFLPWDGHVYSLTVVGSSVNSVKPLSKLSPIETLNLGGNNISDYKFLSKMKRLRRLGLSHNRFSSDSYLFTYLQRPQTRLSSIDLSWCNLSRFGVISNVVDEYDFSFNPDLGLMEIDYNSLGGFRHPLLRLSGNNVSNITFKYPKAKGPFCVSLDLSRTTFSDISKLLKQVYIAEQLSLNNNDIPVLTLNFSKMVSEKCSSGRPSIDLSNCKLSNMSSHIFSSLTLNLLNLSSNQLTALRGSFFRKADILSLDMSNSSIAAISSSVFNYLVVDTLDLSRNNLSSLNGIFDYIESLKNLDVSFNPIETLNEDDLKNCRDLETLNLANAFFKSLGANALFNLASLRSATLSFQNSSINPTEIHNPHLIELTIINSILTHLKSQQFKGFYKLRTLTFINTTVASVDSSVFKGLFNVKKINHHLKALGDYKLSIFQQLYSLEYLDLSGHNLETLNEELRDLYSLKKLNLSSNSLTSLHVNSFATHKQLEMLWLTNNQLSTIPVGTFRELAKLTHLHLNKNQLQQLAPGLFSGLNNLHLLDLSQNDLIRTKPHLVLGVSMPKLTHLYLQGNGLGNEYAKGDDVIRRGEFVVISNHDHLKYIDIDGNGWRCPTLIDILGLFRNRNISCTPTAPDYTKLNINGVGCT